MTPHPSCKNTSGSRIATYSSPTLAVLVEGTSERLLLPLFIQKCAPDLDRCHLSILEIGGAFAHKFRALVEFLKFHA